MPRETAVVRVPDFPGTRNRDKSKIFKITEWPAAKAEHWGIRAMLALGSTNDKNLPLDLVGIGMEGIAIIGIDAFFSATRGMGDNFIQAVVIPLLDELLECVGMIRDQKHPEIVTRLVDGDIEEIATRMWLRGEVLSLHLNFSVSAVFSALYKKIMTRKTSAESSPQPTSPSESPPPSGAASQP